MENPIKMDDLGIPLFLDTPIWNLYFSLLYESLRKSVVCDLLVLAERQPKIAWGILLIIPEQLPLGDIYDIL